MMSYLFDLFGLLIFLIDLFSLKTAIFQILKTGLKDYIIVSSACCFSIIGIGMKLIPI